MTENRKFVFQEYDFLSVFWYFFLVHWSYQMSFTG